MSMEGLVAVVTGSSRGIGKRIALGRNGNRLWHDGIADWVGLGGRCCLTRFLRYWSFFDADEWLTVGPVEDVDPAGLTCFSQSFADDTIDLNIE